MRALLALTLFLLPACLARPDGAPNEACNDMKPGHGVDSQPHHTMPYAVKCEAIDKNTVRFELTGSVKNKFKGLLLQVRDAKNNKLGNFVEIPATFKKSCPGGRAVTHRDAKDKTSIKLKVKVANALSGLKCWFTVVKQFDTFWAAVRVPVKGLAPVPAPVVKATEKVVPPTPVQRSQQIQKAADLKKKQENEKKKEQNTKKPSPSPVVKERRVIEPPPQRPKKLIEKSEIVKKTENIKEESEEVKKAEKKAKKESKKAKQKARKENSTKRKAKLEKKEERKRKRAEKEVEKERRKERRLEKDRKEKKESEEQKQSEESSENSAEEKQKQSEESIENSAEDSAKESHEEDSEESDEDSSEESPFADRRRFERRFM